MHELLNIFVGDYIVNPGIEFLVDHIKILILLIIYLSIFLSFYFARCFKKDRQEIYESLCIGFLLIHLGINSIYLIFLFFQDYYILTCIIIGTLPLASAYGGFCLLDKMKEILQKK